MRHLRMVGLCLVAVFAVAAVAATSASALPEWGQCYEKAGHEGVYANSNCTVKAKVVNLKKTGAYEWRKNTAVAKKHFVGGNAPETTGGVLTSIFTDCNTGTKEGRKVCPPGEPEIEKGYVGPEWVECEKEHDSGEAVGTKGVAHVSVKFSGCKLYGSVPCANGPEGEIQVNPLKGELGYIKKATATEVKNGVLQQVGILLTPEKAKGEFVKFNCGGVLGIVVGVGNEKEGAAYKPEKTGGYDGIISPITPVNTMTKTLTQVYTTTGGALPNEATTYAEKEKEYEKDEQNIPSHFEGKHIELLEAYTFNPEKSIYSSQWSKAGEEVTSVNSPEEEAEIKA
jgi:hypothetical protein